MKGIVILFLVLGCFLVIGASGCEVQTSNASQDAILIAANSECTQKAILTNESSYNPYSKTWWINIVMKPEFKKDNCYPACVVDVEKKTAEINWRCTGLVVPNNTVVEQRIYIVAANNFKFEPYQLTVPIGSTVVWKNEDIESYSVTFNDQSFSERIEPGKNISKKFDAAGEYAYHDSVHGSPNGKIIVE